MIQDPLPYIVPKDHRLPRWEEILDRPVEWRIPWRKRAKPLPWEFAIAHVATNSTAMTLATDDGVTVTTAATADGQVSFAWIVNAGDVAITPPAGWTEIATLTGNGNRVWFGYRVASSDAGSYTWTWTDSRGIGIIAAFSGVDTTNPIFGWIPNAESSTATHNVLALSTLGTDPNASMLLTCLCINRGQTTTTAPTGYTMPANGNPDTTSTTSGGVEAGLAYKSYTGGSGIAATTWTTSNGAANNTVHLAMRASGDTQATVFAWPGAATAGSTTASLALNMPLNVRAGDLLIATVAWKNDSTSASMTGWTQKGSTITKVFVGGTNDYNLATFYQYAASSSPSGTVTLTNSSEVTGNVFAVRRTGTSGDPFADYQTTNDTSANTTSDLAALTVAAQDMLVLGASATRADAVGGGSPTGYTDWGNPVGGIGASRRYTRTGTAATNIGFDMAIKFQTTANPGSTTFTNAGSVETITAHSAIAIGSASTGGRSWVSIW